MKEFMFAVFMVINFCGAALMAYRLGGIDAVLLVGFGTALLVFIVANCR